MKRRNTDFRSYIRKDGQRQIYKVRKGSSKSVYFHGAIWKGFKMYIHKASGAKVTLLEQSGDGMVTAESDGRQQTGPASDFFAAHREATREEIDGEPETTTDLEKTDEK